MCYITQKNRKKNNFMMSDGDGDIRCHFFVLILTEKKIPVKIVVIASKRDKK